MKTTKFSANGAVPAVPAQSLLMSTAPKILPNGHSLGGWLERVEPIGGGLVRVVVSGRERLIDDSLLEELAALTGQYMSVGHYFGQWGCGALPCPDLLIYRHHLCEALEGLDHEDERWMARYLILKIDAKDMSL